MSSDPAATPRLGGPTGIFTTDIWEHIIDVVRWRSLVSLTRCSKEISLIATKALYESIMLNNEETTEKFIKTAIAAVDNPAIQTKLAYVKGFELVMRPIPAPFIISRLHSVPALSSVGKLLFPNLRSLYIEHFVQPLTLYGWEQQTEISFLAGVTHLEVCVAGKRTVVPPLTTESDVPDLNEEEQDGLSWLFSLHPYGLTNLKEVHLAVDYEWLQKASVEMLLGKQPYLEHITIDMETSIARDRQRKRYEDRYWANIPAPRSDWPTFDYRQSVNRERKERIVDTLMNAAEKLHLTYPALRIKGGIQLEVGGDRENEIAHMLIDRVRRRAAIDGSTNYVLGARASGHNNPDS